MRRHTVTLSRRVSLAPTLASPRALLATLARSRPIVGHAHALTLARSWPVVGLARALTARHGSGGARSPGLEEQLENLADEFAEARELLSDAEEAMGTTYFEDDLQDAKEAVEQVLETYDAIKASLPEGSAELIDVQRSLGLKIEELRGRYSLLIQSLIEED